MNDAEAFWACELRPGSIVGPVKDDMLVSHAQLRVLLSDEEQSDVHGAGDGGGRGAEDGHHASRCYDVNLPHCVRLCTPMRPWFP